MTSDSYRVMDHGIEFVPGLINTKSEYDDINENEDEDDEDDEDDQDEDEDEDEYRSINDVLKQGQTPHQLECDMTYGR